MKTTLPLPLLCFVRSHFGALVCTTRKALPCSLPSTLGRDAREQCSAAASDATLRLFQDLGRHWYSSMKDVSLESTRLNNP